MRRTIVLLMVMAVCVWAAATSSAQQTQNQNVAAPHECVAVIGAVMLPGRFELKRQIKLLEAISFAGGFKPNAGATVQVISTHRKCVPETSDVKVPSETVTIQTYRVEDLIGPPKGGNQEALNRYLEAGDLVVVSEGETAYVTGAVFQPRQIALRRPVTVTEAIIMAGGLKKEAKLESVRIIRTTTASDQRQEILVNLKDARKHKAHDLVLQPDDIVEVPGLNRPGPMLPIRDTPVPVKPDHAASALRSER